MQREIYEVTAKIIDANGTFNTLTGYPKTFDSKNYGNNIVKAYKRAEGEWHDAMSAMSKIDTRPIQIAYVIRISDGVQVLNGRYGDMPDVPDEGTT